MTQEEAESTESRRIGRAWVWMLLVVAVVAGALAVSFRAERSVDDAGAPINADIYCSTASELKGMSDLKIEVGPGGGDGMRQVQTVLRQLASVAPDPIARDVHVVIDSFDPVIDAAESQVGGPDALASVTDVLNEQQTAVADEAGRVSQYTRNWCGFDMMADGSAAGPEGN